MPADSQSIETTSSARLLEGLANYLPVWGRWIEHARKHGPADAGEIMPPEEIARHLRIFLAAEEGRPCPRRVKERIALLRRLFGFVEQDGRELDPGQGRLRVRFDETGRRVVALYFALKAVDNRRDQSVILHEMGHVFYAIAWEIAGLGKDRDPFARSKDAERFSWRFASECVLPQAELKSLDRRAYRQVLAGTVPEGTALDRLTFLGIRTLAGHFSVSLRLMIVALDHSRLLNQMEAGIAVIANTPNKVTGESQDLRVTSAARPRWGHIITNERAIRQGFMKAYQVFESSPNMVSRTIREVLRLKRHHPEGKPAWSVEEIPAECEYTPVDVRDEGRYLIVVWDWPRR